MPLIVTTRTVYHVIRIQPLNPRRWTIIDGVYVFDSLYINRGNNISRLATRVNSTSYRYPSYNNYYGLPWMNTTPNIDHNNINNVRDSRVNNASPASPDSIQSLDHDNNDNVGVSSVNPTSPNSTQSLEKFTIDRPSYSPSMPSCSICLDEFSVGSEATRTPCSHVYHKDCIIQWLNTCNTCPLCRRTI